MYLVVGDPDDPIYTTQVELDLEVVQRVRLESLQVLAGRSEADDAWQNPAYLP